VTAWVLAAGICGDPCLYLDAKAARKELGKKTMISLSNFEKTRLEEISNIK
jgi:hypothetical protein